MNSCAVEHFIFLRRHILGEVVDLTPSFSAVHPRIRQWKND